MRPFPEGPPGGIPGWKSKEPLDLVAQLLLALSYTDMMELAADLHSDIVTHEPKPIDIADQLHRWARRMSIKEQQP